MMVYLSTDEIYCETDLFQLQQQVLIGEQSLFTRKKQPSICILIFGMKMHTINALPI